MKSLYGIYTAKGLKMTVIYCHGQAVIQQHLFHQLQDCSAAKIKGHTRETALIYNMQYAAVYTIIIISAGLLHDLLHDDPEVCAGLLSLLDLLVCLS